MGVNLAEFEGIVDQAASATTPDERTAAIGELSDKVAEAISGHDSNFFTKAPARLRSLERFFAQQGEAHGEIPMMIRQLRFAQGRTRVEERWQAEEQAGQPTTARRRGTLRPDVLAFIRAASPAVRPIEIADALGSNLPSVSRALRELLDDGLVVLVTPEGEDRRGHWYEAADIAQRMTARAGEDTLAVDALTAP